MKFPGMILMGAQTRLLDPTIPYRYFGAAVFYHILSWGLLLAGADHVSGFQGGPGPVLAALHALTLGVLAMTAMGASFQILPVATGAPLPAVWPTRAASWLMIPGVGVLVWGLWTGDHAPMAAGALAVVAALVLFGWVVGRLLARTRGLRVLTGFLWLALAALVGLAALGAVLVADLGHGLLEWRQPVIVLHLVLAIYGFMGMLSLGYTHVLVPMFALSQGIAPARAGAAFALAALALATAAAAAAFGSGEALAAAAIVGLAAAAVHIHAMLGALRHGMRKTLGLSFVLVRTAWALLPTSLIAGGLTALGLLGERGVLLFGFAALWGWLLTLLMGLLQRILPFLAAMNAHKAGAPPPRLSELSTERPLRIHALAHFGALTLVAAGLALESEPLIRAGAAAGLLGAIAFAGFAFDVYRRMRAAPTEKTT